MAAEVRLPAVNIAIMGDATVLERATRRANRALDRNRKNLRQSQRAYQRTTVVVNNFATGLRGIGVLLVLVWSVVA